jgi:hypothetical protein
MSTDDIVGVVEEEEDNATSTITTTTHCTPTDEPLPGETTTTTLTSTNKMTIISSTTPPPSTLTTVASTPSLQPAWMKVYQEQQQQQQQQVKPAARSLPDGRGVERTKSWEKRFMGSGACYLVYDAVHGELNIYYSEIPIVGAVGVWTSDDIHIFKQAQGLSQSELIGNCASGVVQDRKLYYQGWSHHQG